MRSEGRGRLQKRHEGASVKLWLGRGLHTGTTDEPQPRGNARWGRFWVAVLVQVPGFGAMTSTNGIFTVMGELYTLGEVY